MCDADLLGKTFEEGRRQLEVRESFYKGEEMSHEDLVKLIKFQVGEDSTFNIVGQKAIAAAKEAGIISKEAVSTIQNIPFSLILL
jgi:hypothetical protein